MLLISVCEHTKTKAPSFLYSLSESVTGSMIGFKSLSLNTETLKLSLSQKKVGGGIFVRRAIGIIGAP